MFKSQTGVYLLILQHEVKHLRLLQDVFIIAAGETDFDVAHLQIHAHQCTANGEYQFKEPPFGFLKHEFAILRPCFRSRPAITHDDRRPRITCGGTAVAIRHTTDGQNRLIHMVYKGLGFSLVQRVNQVGHFRFQLRVNILELDSPFLTQLLEVIRRNIHVMEKHEGLNELLNTVNTVAVRQVDSIQKRNNQLKRTNAGKVQRIFDNGNVTQNVILVIDDFQPISHILLRVNNLKILILRVAGVVNIVVPIDNILHAKHRLVAKAVVIHHKGISWVKRINLKRGVIFLSTFIRKNHAEGRSANVEPVSQLLVLCGLFLRKHKFVKLVDGLCNVLRIATGHILQRFTHQIPGLERHNLVRPVLHNLIANLWPYLLFSIENWLSALVVIPEIFNFRPVLPVNGKCLA